MSLWRHSAPNFTESYIFWKFVYITIKLVNCFYSMSSIILLYNVGPILHLLKSNENFEFFLNFWNFEYFFKFFKYWSFWTLKKNIFLIDFRILKFYELFVRNFFWNKTGSSCCNIIHETGSCHFDMTHFFRPVLTYINN